MTIGFIGFAVCSIVFGSVNLEIGPYTLLIPIMLTGLCLSFVFIPMATLMMSTIPRQETGNATASPTCCAISAARSASPWPPRH